MTEQEKKKKKNKEQSILMDYIMQVMKKSIKEVVDQSLEDVLKDFK